MYNRLENCRWALLLASAMVAGCGGRDPDLPPLVPVDGTVRLDGQPLSHATVTFYPVGQTRGVGGAAYTDENGRYEAESGSEKGLPAGQYRVFVSKLVMPDGSPYSAKEGVPPMESDAREAVPLRYTDMDQSPLEATVPRAGGTIDFELTGRP